MTTRTNVDFTPFADLPDTAQIKFYSLHGERDSDNLEPLISVVREILNQWKEGGKIQDGAAELLLDNRFLAVSFQPTSADISGCTKDSLTHVLQDFEKRLGISILNSPRFSVMTGNGVQHLSMKEFRERRGAGEFTEDTIVFDHLIQNMGEARNGAFETSVKKSWYAPVGA